MPLVGEPLVLPKSDLISERRPPQWAPLFGLPRYVNEILYLDIWGRFGPSSSLTPPVFAL